MKKIFYIKFKDIADLPKSFEKECFEIFNEELLDNMITYTSSDGGDYMILNFEVSKLERLVKAAKDVGMFESYLDITESIAMGEYVNDDVELFMNTKLLKRMIYNHMTIDMVLDKISSKGMDSLTDVDKAILKEK